MAWAVRLERGSAVRWIARWREPSGRQRGKVFDRRGDALAYARTMEEWKRGEAYIDPDRGRTTLAEFVEAEVLTDPGLSEKTRATYLGAWERDIAPTLGSRKLNSITRADVTLVSESRMLEAFRDGVSETTLESLVDPGHPIPFANLEWPAGVHKLHGIRGGREGRVATAR
jgi:hypothetical protein